MAQVKTVETEAPRLSASNGNGYTIDAPESGSRQGVGNKKLAVGIALAVLVIAGVVFGFRYWEFATTHTGTDDAYVTSNVVQISPQVSGTVVAVMVHDNQVVQKGQLLAVLDDATIKANVAQAKANLDAAIAQGRGAGVTVDLTRETGGALVEQARGQVAQADSGIAGARQDVARANAAVTTSIAQASGAESNIRTLQAGVQAAIAALAKASAAVDSSQAQVLSAQAATRSAQANLDAAQAAADRATRDAQRYSALADQGAMSRQVADQAATTSRSAQANVEAARQQLEAAAATADARKSDLGAAREQVLAAKANVAQAKAQVASGRDAAAAARAGIAESQALRNAAQEGISTAEARRQQAEGQLGAASTTSGQVAVSRSSHAQAVAKIEQARAALDQAKLQLSYTRIVAPTTGLVSKKTVEVGALVQAGTPLMAIVPQSDIWIVANLKETQMNGVQKGRAAEIDVDAVPGHVFHGHVDSISAATGATFALLPADNASGNFTKVVQRIPVKIALDDGQPEADRLRAGMSADVTIAIH
ncbi:MAG TPA: HlyD family secretion protein [Armatimonadota bacterium]|jgi:membrane fusion protein (multidrug efflux system)